MEFNFFSKYLCIDKDNVLDINLELLNKYENLEDISVRNLFIDRKLMSCICSVKTLKILSFYNCNICDLSFLSDLSITELVIENCIYDDLFLINNLENLEKLDLANNEIIDLKELPIIRNIKQLSLSNVEILNYDYFISMDNIETLAIDGTNIEKVSYFLCFDKLKKIVIDEKQLLQDKKVVRIFKDKGVSVVDNMNRDVEFIYG